MKNRTFENYQIIILFCLAIAAIFSFVAFTSPLKYVSIIFIIIGLIYASIIYYLQHESRNTKANTSKAREELLKHLK